LDKDNYDIDNNDPNIEDDVFEEFEEAEEEADETPLEEPRSRWPLRILALLIIVSFIGLTIPNLQFFFGDRPGFLDENQALLHDEIVQISSPSVVGIEAYKTGGTLQGTTHQGTGFNILPSGRIITNNHVIEGADRVTVRFPDGSKYDAVSYQLFADVDLAVIEIEGEDLPFLAINHTDAAEEGDTVTVIGNPLGFKKIAQRGTVGRFYRVYKVAIPVFDVGISLHPGNSGSPVINTQGEVVGVIFAVTEEEDEDGETTGLAIPIQVLPKEYLPEEQ
jgi:S1-C subfamily serine protease